MKTTAVLLLLAAQVTAANEIVLDMRDWPLRIGGEAQLFIDDHLIASRTGLRFRVHQPVKHAANPLIVPSLPFESNVLAYGSVLRGPSGEFRMWYTNNIGIAYAESRDGVRWAKPSVGLEFDGHKTNVLTRGHRGRSDTLTVLENPDRSDPARRFLAYPMEYRFPDKDGIRETLREGIYLRASPDGIRWTERPDPVMYSIWRNRQDQPGNTNAALGDVHHVYWDPKLRKFIGHIKLEIDTVRTRGLVESDDGIHWSDPRLILRADDQDRPGDQIYSMIAFPYESAWLAFIGLFHKGTDERMDIQIVSSRDGRHWRRPLRDVFLPNGPEGSFDWGVMHMIANPPIRIGDKLYIYYDGSGAAHNVKLRDVKHMGIGLATLRPDGFISLDAGAEPGLLVTRPLEAGGSRLQVNAAIRSGGEIQVRVLDTRYNPIEGFVSTPLSGDGLDLPVVWTSQRALPAGAKRLEFRMKEASLYSFRIY